MKPEDVRLNERKIPKQVYVGATWLVLFLSNCRVAEHWWGSAEFRGEKKTHSPLLPFKETLIIDSEALCSSVLRCTSSLLSDISRAFSTLHHLFPAFAFLASHEKKRKKKKLHNDSSADKDREFRSFLQSLNSCNVLGSISGRSSSHTSSAISVHAAHASPEHTAAHMYIFMSPDAILINTWRWIKHLFFFFFFFPLSFGEAHLETMHQITHVSLQTAASTATMKIDKCH